MASINKVILVGHLGQDPEIRSFPNGGKICNLSVATSEKWKDRNTGEIREKTEWHRVVVNGDGLVGIAERFLKKGSRVYLEGQLRTRKWQDQSGADRYSTEVALSGYRSALVLLDRAAGSGSSGSSGSPGYGGGTSDSGPQNIDDEIPF